MSGIPDDNKPASQAKKVLIVQDSFANRDMLTRRLQRRGFTVCCAADGSGKGHEVGCADFDCRSDRFWAGFKAAE